MLKKQKAFTVIKMKLTRTILPWSGVPVTTTGDIYSYFRGRQPDEVSDYLPRSITIYADAEITESEVGIFIAEMSAHLERELPVRKARRDRFVALGLFDNAGIDDFLTTRADLQPWVLYYSYDGGLRTPVLNPDETEEPFGVVPCSTMQNHGIAWRRVGLNGDYRLWLVTARKEGQPWDWDSDIGHESAHSAFAQIPLYIQPDQKTVPSYDLARVRSADELSVMHLARMSYMYMEMAVIAVRGEHRHTESGLPLAERVDELQAFLKLSHELMPQLGFDRALTQYERAEGVLDYDSGAEIFEIGAAAMRVVPHLSRRINSVEVPDASWFRSVGQRRLEN